MSLPTVLRGILSQLKRHDKQIGEAKRLLVHNPLNAGKASLKTIVGGVISVAKPHVVVLPESGTADNLDEIENFADGKFIVLSTADVGDTITVRDESVSGGNIALRGVTTRVLSDPEDSLLLIYKESVGFWIQAGGIPAGGAPSAHASTHQHGGTDEVATATPAANAIPKAGGSGTLALGWIPAGGTPGAHATTHQHGGSDEVATATPGNNAIPKAGGSGKLANGWLDATLESLAALGTVADRIAYTTGVDIWAETPLTSFARTYLDDANEAAVRVTLGLAAGGAGDIWVEKAGDTMGGNLDFANTHFIVNLPDPSSPQHAATKAYVDALLTGLDFKGSVRAATTANITLSAPQTIDGIAVIAGDRVLVKNQSTGANNGIYVVAAGAWSRATDADTSAEVTSGMWVIVEEGTVNDNTAWILTTNNPITLATTSLTFSPFLNFMLVDGSGLSFSGNTLNANVDNSTIEINADIFRVKDAGITNAKRANMAEGTISGRYIGVGTGVPTDLTLLQLVNMMAEGMGFITDEAFPLLDDDVFIVIRGGVPRILTGLDLVNAMVIGVSPFYVDLSSTQDVGGIKNWVDGIYSGRPLAADAALNIGVDADTDPRFLVQADGKIIWGTGAAVGDTNLYRSGASILKTDDDFHVAGLLQALGASDFDGAANFDGLATFNAGVAALIGAYTFSFNGVSPAQNYLQVAFTRGATQFGGVTIFVSMIARKAVDYRRGLQVVQVNSSNAAAMPWTVTHLAAGITTTATTDTSTNLTLKFDLGTTAYTDMAVHMLIVGLKHANITVTPSMIV